MKIYFGTPGFGWIMYGIGYKDKWFLGFSMNRAAIEAKEAAKAEQQSSNHSLDSGLSSKSVQQADAGGEQVEIMGALTIKQHIEAAWCAGYYHAGYTHDQAYADQESGKYAVQALASYPPVPAQQGLSDDIDSLITQATNLAFDCGEWDGEDNDEYQELAQRSASARQRLKAAIESALRPQEGVVQQEAKPKRPLARWLVKARNLGYESIDQALNAAPPQLEMPQGSNYGDVLDQLYAAWHREAPGDTFAAIGAAIQEIQAMRELALPQSDTHPGSDTGSRPGSQSNTEAAQVVRDKLDSLTVYGNNQQAEAQSKPKTPTGISVYPSRSGLATSYPDGQERQLTGQGKEGGGE